MNDVYLAIDFAFNCMTSIFNLMVSHWIFGVVVIASIMSLIISLIIMVRGSK